QLISRCDVGDRHLLSRVLNAGVQSLDTPTIVSGSVERLRAASKCKPNTLHSMAERDDNGTRKDATHDFGCRLPWPIRKDRSAGSCKPSRTSRDRAIRMLGVVNETRRVWR
uniref:Uncharacterized protein n=1 Tax=Anopheles quadriannulatus TaxID=34691 RepID=A0A182X8C9_ANOQN